MGIEENIQESIMEIPGSEENVSEKYDKMRAKKMEALYKNDSRNMFLVHIAVGMLMKGY